MGLLRHCKWLRLHQVGEVELLFPFQWVQHRLLLLAKRRGDLAMRIY
jgi:hypothetical protein